MRLPGPDGDRDGDELEIELRSVETVARWVAGCGPDAVVRHPPELAAAVRRSCAHVLAAHLGPAGPDPDPDPAAEVPGPRAAEPVPAAGEP
jgi:hypothetical protein